MSSPPPTIPETIEQQQQVFEREQESITDAIQFPFRQVVELQRNAAQILLSGLELTEANQRTSMGLTRSMLQSYLRSFEGAMAPNSLDASGWDESVQRPPAELQGDQGTRQSYQQQMPLQQQPTHSRQSAPQPQQRAQAPPEHHRQSRRYGQRQPLQPEIPPQ